MARLCCSSGGPLKESDHPRPYRGRGRRHGPLESVLRRRAEAPRARPRHGGDGSRDGRRGARRLSGQKASPSSGSGRARSRRAGRTSPSRPRRGPRSGRSTVRRSPREEGTTARRVSGPTIIRTISAPSSSIPTATISRPCATGWGSLQPYSLSASGATSGRRACSSRSGQNPTLGAHAGTSQMGGKRAYRSCRGRLGVRPKQASIEVPAEYREGRKSVIRRRRRNGKAKRPTPCLQTGAGHSAERRARARASRVSGSCSARPTEPCALLALGAGLALSLHQQERP